VEPLITFQPVEVLHDDRDHEGYLVLADGRLAAVIVRLADPEYGQRLVGSWYLEAGFGSLEMRHDLFASLEDAARTIADLVPRFGKRPLG